MFKDQHQIKLQHNFKNLFLKMYILCLAITCHLTLVMGSDEIHYVLSKLALDVMDFIGLAKQFANHRK